VPEFRRDPTTDEWVIVAAERARRPGVSGRLLGGDDRERDPGCPFCPGNEEQTPPEILRRPPGVEWHVRVVPNKYPALVPDLPDEREASDGLHASMPAKGHYEVIVEGPSHRSRLASESHEVLAQVFLAARDRYREFRFTPGLEYFSLFKNHGPHAGASLTHPHWQLVAAPVVPGHLRRMLEVAERHWKAHGTSVYADVVAAEREAEVRLIDEAEGFLVFAPYAPQWSGESWVVPERNGASLGEAGDVDPRAFATALHDALARTAMALNDPDCNVVVFSAPLGMENLEYFTWHGRIQPRLTVPGGFELASGTAITTMAPEQTAMLLRSAVV
jgi:UDPglucose--hexose-1-phosphate uridylyltransferase